MDQDNATRTRAQKGLGLYLSGAVTQKGDAYKVEGTTQSYTVWIGTGDPRCDCPDYTKRGETCKHGYAVVAYAARHSRRRKVGKANSWSFTPEQVAANLARMKG